MTDKAKQSEEIQEQIEEFENQGGEVEKLPSKEELKEIQRQRKALAAEEKRIREALNENKSERKEVRDKIKEKRGLFEKARAAHGKHVTTLNRIHLTKSAIKHFKEFEAASTEYLLSLEVVQSALDEYLQALREANEVL